MNKVKDEIITFLALQKQLRHSHPVSSPSGSSSSSSPTSGAADADADASRAESGSEESLPREEVIRRLRALRQPATLFAEDDVARLRRLQDLIENPAALADVDAAEIGEGQTNDFLRDNQALRAKAAAATKPKAAGAEAQRGEAERCAVRGALRRGQDHRVLQKADGRVDSGGERYD
jgi:pre-mRNA-splicing factor 18